MLTLKIRVPYKEGTPEEVIEKIASCILQSNCRSYGIQDGTVVIKFDSIGKMPDVVLDTRLLEITGG